MLASTRASTQPTWPKVIEVRTNMRADAAAELVTLYVAIRVHHQKALRLRKR
jgi:hypothetical protein